MITDGLATTVRYCTSTVPREYEYRTSYEYSVTLWLPTSETQRYYLRY